MHAPQEGDVVKLITLEHHGEPGQYALTVLDCPDGKVERGVAIDSEVFSNPADGEAELGLVAIEVFVSDDYRTVLETGGFTSIEPALFDLFWDRIRAKMWELSGPGF